MRSRIVTILITITLLCGFTLPISATTAVHNRSCETYMISHINKYRSSHGRKPLRDNTTLSEYAVRWSYRMAKVRVLGHDPNLSKETARWLTYGQNVGDYPTCISNWTHFLKSAEHRDNLLYRGYKYLGVGVVNSAGFVWVTQNFTG